MSLPDPRVAELLSAMTWSFAPDDGKTVQLFENRIKGAARRDRPITYSDLVRDVEFSLKSGPHFIDLVKWPSDDQALLADYLGFIATRSYLDGGFLSTALVIEKSNGTPGPEFYALATNVGLLDSQSERSQRDFWTQHMRLAHTHHQALV